MRLLSLAFLFALVALAQQKQPTGNDGQATGVAMKHLKSQGASASGTDVAHAVRALRG